MNYHLDTQQNDGILLQQEEHHNHKTTPRQAFLHLLKGYVGPGCLSLPWAISQIGLVPGVIACFVLGFWSSFNCSTIVWLKRQQRSTTMPLTEDTATTYPQVAGWLCGKRAQSFTTACIMVQQLAICTVFLSFTGTNLQAFLSSIWSSIQISHSAVITYCLPIVILLSMIPNLKSLAPVTAAATGLLLLGLFFLLVFMGVTWGDEHPNDNNNENNNNNQHLTVTSLALALCAFLYSYEGICLILPVEASMEKPQHFEKTFWSAMAASATIFAVISALSYLAFGEVTNGSITAFLLRNYSEDATKSAILHASNVAVSLSVLATYPLQLFPAIELVQRFGHSRRQGFSSVNDEEAVESYSDTDSDSQNDEFQIAPRLYCVAFTYLVAIAIPNVESLISLAGAFAGSSTALIIPPVLHLAYCRQNNIFGWRIVRDVTLVGFGLLFLIIGTYAAIGDIVQSYH